MSTKRTFEEILQDHMTATQESSTLDVDTNTVPFSDGKSAQSSTIGATVADIYADIHSELRLDLSARLGFGRGLFEYAKWTGSPTEPATPPEATAPTKTSPEKAEPITEPTFARWQLSTAGQMAALELKIVDEVLTLTMVKSAFRRRVRESHPDLNPTASLDRFLREQTAYEILCKELIELAEGLQNRKAA